jgi:hypothetical protein
MRSNQSFFIADNSPEKPSLRKNELYACDSKGTTASEELSEA